MNAYLDLIKLDGTLAMVGRIPGSLANQCWRPALSPSLAGRFHHRRNSRDAGDAGFLCRPWHLAADIELIRIQQINEAYERLLKSDVKYRFVIDMASLK